MTTSLGQAEEADPVGQAEEADLAGQAEEAEGQAEEAGDVRWTDRHEMEDGQTVTERGR